MPRQRSAPTIETDPVATPEEAAVVRARAQRTSLALEALLALGAGLVAATLLGGNLPLVTALLAVWLTSAYYRGSTVLSPSRRQIRSVGRSAGFTMAAVSLAVAFGLVDPNDVGSAVMAVLAATVCAALIRIVRRRSRGPIRALLVGDRVAVTALASRWLVGRKVQVVSTCIVEPDLAAEDYPQEVLGAPVLDDAADIPATASRLDVDAVIVCPGPGFTAADMRRLAWSLEHTPTSLGVIGVLDGTAPHRISAGQLSGSLVMDISPARAPSFVRTVKSVVDRTVGSILLLLTSPVFLLLCLLIRVDSRGPALFTQQRVGERGQLFTMYKLRTMCTDAEQRRTLLEGDNESDGPLFKMANDPRVTRVGRLLRRASLDELPQLLNVVKGEMSLVGPRPALPAEVAEYDDDTRRRLAVKPGLTGLWQVSGRSDLPWEQAVALDLYYTDNWRLSDDALIALRTADAVIRSRGAY